MSGEVAIPMLPCVSLLETLEFYQSLGFVVTYQQKSPNPYGVVKREDAELHFFGLKGLDPKSAFSTCAIIVREVEPLYQELSEALRKKYGKLPVAGLPRIARMKKGQSRFHVVDPSGNWIRFIQNTEAPDANKSKLGEGASRLARAIETAVTLRDFSGDDLKAAKVLDAALARDDAGSQIERARALAIRAELASVLEERETLQRTLAALQELPLTEEERRELHNEL